MSSVKGMKIKHSYFDYGGEIEVCDIFQMGDKTGRLFIRRIGDQYELCVCTYGFLKPGNEAVITQDTLEKVVQVANALMWEQFGTTWEGDVIVPEDSMIYEAKQERKVMELEDEGV